ncbi:MAG TPA: amidohydrolase family protein [Patescibacteria group bacterium]|nr:amidohydrolase family protein [Patescibacteria group bacterium]
MTDIFVKNGFVLTMQGEGVGTIMDGAVAIEGNKIVAVGKTADLTKEYGGMEHVFDARGKAVLPGFVDAHIHTSNTLIRGEGQDVPEIEWMLKTQAPFGPHYRPGDRLLGSALGVLEAVKCGTTCFGEIGGNMAPAAEKVFGPSGVRAHLANTINEIGPGSRPDPHKPYIFFEDIGERKLKESIEFIEKWNGAVDGRITTMFSPHAADMMSEDLLLRVKEEANKRGMLSHIHIAQGGREAIQIKLRFNTTTVKYLDSIGFLDNTIIGAHCHQTSDEEVAMLAQRGMRYVSCPASIGVIDGITAPLALYLAFGGVSAGIGSDQASGNNHHNMLVEMKVAALLNKCRHTDPTVLPAWKMLRIATIEGAETIGLGDSIGSLEPGKKADLLILNLKVPHMMPIITTPVPNVAPNIVYSARGDEIETVIIDGKLVVKDHVVLTMNEEKIMEDAQRASTEITTAAAEDYFKADSYLAKAVKAGLL